MQELTQVEEQIIEALKVKERESGMKPSTFARSLNISPALWILTMARERPLGVTLSTAAAKAFPELESLVVIFLRFELPTRKRKVRVSKKIA